MSVSGDEYAPTETDEATGENETWELRLYVTDRSPKCLRAIMNLRSACEEYLPGRFRIEVVDLIDDPRRAAEDQILAVPTTVVRMRHGKVRKIVGDLSDTGRLLDGLQVRKQGSAI